MGVLGFEPNRRIYNKNFSLTCICIAVTALVVRVGRLELPASCSQSTRAASCATPGFIIKKTTFGKDFLLGYPTQHQTLEVGLCSQQNFSLRDSLLHPLLGLAQ